MEPGTSRSRAKAARRTALVDAAITLFAEHGFTPASLEEIGAAAGVSGPAVYRHFPSKQAVLAAILVGQSTELLAGGREVIARVPDPERAITELVAFHVDFSVTRSGVIRIQDRDLDKLSDEDQHTARSAQRAYVELWVGVLQALHPAETAAALRVRAHAAFGLMNSTPHTAGRGPQVRRVIERMTLVALRDRLT